MKDPIDRATTLINAMTNLVHALSELVEKLKPYMLPLLVAALAAS